MTIFSASDFVDQIVEQYLIRINSISPKDVALREEIIREIQYRLVSLSTHLRAHVIEETRLQRSILRLLATNKRTVEKPTGTNWTSLGAITESEKTWYRAMTRRLEETNQAIQDRTVCWQKEQETARVEIERLNEKIRRLQLENYSNVQQLKYMEQMLKKQDVQLAVFIRERKELDAYVRIAKKDVVQTLDAMKPYMTWYFLYKVQDDTPLDERLSGVLTEQLGLLLEQIDRYKRRIKETSDRAEELERDMDETLLLLGVGPSEGTTRTLKGALLETVDNNTRQKAELAETVRRLNGQIVELKKDIARVTTGKFRAELNGGTTHNPNKPPGSGIVRAGRETGSDDVPNATTTSTTTTTTTTTTAELAHREKTSENAVSADRVASSSSSPRHVRQTDKNTKRKAVPQNGTHSAMKSNSRRNPTSAGSARTKPEPASPADSEEPFDERATERKRFQKTKLPFSIAAKK